MPSLGDPLVAEQAERFRRTVRADAERDRAVTAAAGYLREFPRWRLLPVIGKVPTVPLSAATRDPARLREWMEAHGTNEFAALTGYATGLAVVDVDDERVWTPGYVPAEIMDTACIRTPRGRHYLFTLDRPLASRHYSPPHAPGPDLVLADGAAVPLPPSGGRRWERRGPLAPLPELPPPPRYALNTTTTGGSHAD